LRYVSRALFAVPLLVLVPGVTLLAARFHDAKRRSHFGLRVGVVCLSVPAVLVTLIVLALIVGHRAAAAMLILIVVLDLAGLMFVESILFDTSDSSSGGGGDDWGHGPGQPPSRPDRPRGQLPLPDSEVGRWRLRDHSGTDLGDGPSRRTAREPKRVL
jgi:hypothetical protein